MTAKHFTIAELEAMSHKLPPHAEEMTLFIDAGSAMTASNARDLLVYGCWKATAAGTYVGVTHQDTDVAARAIRAALETLGVKS
jgi:hypothetical protein